MPALVTIGYAAFLAQELTNWSLTELFSSSATATTVLGTLLLLSLTVLFQSLNAVFVKWLSGDAPWIPRWFETRQNRRRKEMDREVQDLLDRYSLYSQRAVAWQKRLDLLQSAKVTTTAHEILRNVLSMANGQQPDLGQVRAEHVQLVHSVVAAAASGAISKTDLKDACFQLRQLFATTMTQFRIEIGKRQGERYGEFRSDVVRETRFGNRAIAIDSYIEKRYGMPTDVLCSRLRQVDATKDRWATVDDAKAALDFMVAFVWINVAAAGVLIALMPTAWRANPAVLIALPIWLGLAWASYVASLQAVGEMGLQLAAVVDVYRWDLLRALHLAEPKNAQEEFEAWNRLGGFIMASPRKEEREALWFR